MKPSFRHACVCAVVVAVGVGIGVHVSGALERRATCDGAEQHGRFRMIDGMPQVCRP